MVQMVGWPSSTAEDAARARRISVRNARIRREERWTEIHHLLEGGMSPENAAKHVGASVESLSRQAYRHEMPEMGRLFNNVTPRRYKKRKKKV